MVCKVVGLFLFVFHCNWRLKQGAWVGGINGREKKECSAKQDKKGCVVLLLATE